MPGSGSGRSSFREVAMHWGAGMWRSSPPIFQVLRSQTTRRPWRGKADGGRTCAAGCGAQVGDFSERRYFGHHALLGGKGTRVPQPTVKESPAIPTAARRRRVAGSGGGCIPGCQRAPDRRAVKWAGAGPGGHVCACPFTGPIVVDAARAVKRISGSKGVSGWGHWSYCAIGARRKHVTQ